MNRKANQAKSGKPPHVLDSKPILLSVVIP